MNVKPKKKPKWYQLRKVVCRWLVHLARWVEPRSEEIYAFHLQQMMDAMIYGGSITRINPMITQWGTVAGEKQVMNAKPKTKTDAMKGFL